MDASSPQNLLCLFHPVYLQSGIEAVFRQMVPNGDDEDNKIDVPLKFWDFYNCGIIAFVVRVRARARVRVRVRV